MDEPERSSKAESQSRNESLAPSLEAEKVERSTRLIERLFARFSAVYGSKFANAWAGSDPEEMKRVWSERLARFDLRQVGRAVELCETTVKHPPTLPEFIDLVRSCHFVDGLVALQHKAMMPPPKSEAECIASREYPRPANGFGIYWAQQIVRLEQLGAYGHFAPLMSAMSVLGIKNISELQQKYPPRAQEGSDPQNLAA